ncbi:MAG: hypothetical protein MJ016_06350, partial [Victivallaceae bacterium]|nr:hypothetical protein [Victivallaceae bacterium]
MNADTAPPTPEKLWFPALSSSHFLADMLGAVLPGILPAALLFFGLELQTGVLLLGVLGITANVFQIPAALISGRMIPARIALISGLACASAVLTLAFFPPETPWLVLLTLMIVTGVGIAFVHPAGVTQVQSLGTLSPKIAVPVYMTCGFFGAAAGPWIAALLVESGGMKMLFYLFVPVAAEIALLAFS